MLVDTSLCCPSPSVVELEPDLGAEATVVTPAAARRRMQQAAVQQTTNIAADIDKLMVAAAADRVKLKADVAQFIAEQSAADARFDTKLTDIGAAMWTPIDAQRIGECSRLSTAQLFCNAPDPSASVVCSAAMVRHRGRWIVLTAGHCASCGPSGTWQIASLAQRAGSLRTCSVLVNASTTVDGMILDCGAPDGLVRPLTAAVAKPRSRQTLLLTGFADGHGSSDVRLALPAAYIGAAEELIAYLHTMSTHAVAAFVDSLINDSNTESTVVLANGSHHNLTECDAFTEAGQRPQRGMSGGPVLSTTCELVGVVRGHGVRNDQGVYVPVHALLQLFDLHIYHPPFECQLGGTRRRLYVPRGGEDPVQIVQNAASEAGVLSEWIMQEDADMGLRCIWHNTLLLLRQRSYPASVPRPLASARGAIARCKIALLGPGRLSASSNLMIFVAPGESVSEAVDGFLLRTGFVLHVSSTGQQAVQASILHDHFRFAPSVRQEALACLLQKIGV